jgi:hypothetical protein
MSFLFDFKKFKMIIKNKIQENNHTNKNNTDDVDLRIYQLLLDPTYYSLALPYLAMLAHVSQEYLYSLDVKKNCAFQRRFDDFINIFTFNDVVYIGLESRRIAYENDKKNNCNCVENAIRAGWYG